MSSLTVFFLVPPVDESSSKRKEEKRKDKKAVQAKYLMEKYSRKWKEYILKKKRESLQACAVLNYCQVYHVMQTMLCGTKTVTD